MFRALEADVSRWNWGRGDNCSNISVATPQNRLFLCMPKWALVIGSQNTWWTSIPREVSISEDNRSFLWRRTRWVRGHRWLRDMCLRKWNHFKGGIREKQKPHKLDPCFLGPKSSEVIADARPRRFPYQIKKHIWPKLSDTDVHTDILMLVARSKCELRGIWHSTWNEILRNSSEKHIYVHTNLLLMITGRKWATYPFFWNRSFALFIRI